jgi:hypothetical protein
MQSSQVKPPGAEATAWLSTFRDTITLEDGVSAQNPNPLPFHDAANQSAPVRVGDMVRNVMGPLMGTVFSSSGYKIVRADGLPQPVFEMVNLRQPQPPSVGAGALKVAAFNVLNYFNG